MTDRLARTIAALLLMFLLSTTPATAGSIVGWGDNTYGQATPPAGTGYTAIAASAATGIALAADSSIVMWGFDGFGAWTVPAGTGYRALAAGGHHFAALAPDGSIVQFGDNLGPAPGGTGYQAVAAGGYHSIALAADGSIDVWGWDAGYGGLDVPAGTGYVAIDAGSYHNLALAADGSIVGAGLNDSGQATPPAGTGYLAIAAGGSHSLALAADGSIVGWGLNHVGQATPPAGNGYLAIAAGANYSLALAADSSIVAWGQGTFGELNAPAGNGYFALAAGSFHCLALTGTTAAPAVTPDATGLCISTAHTCITLPVLFEGSGTNDARGISVTVQLSPELELCGAITQGDWLSGFASVYQALDGGGGIYTIDQSILGTPCGTTAGGTLFELPLQKAAGVTSDDVGTVSVTSVTLRDCANQPLTADPGPDASVTIDITGPTSVADLAAAQRRTGNDSDGTTRIDLTLSVPGDADSVMVFRKGFGDYPEYDDGTGAVPTAPATPAAAISDGWTLTPVSGSGQADEPANRDFWYYVVFTDDACDNLSAVSNMTSGTLNYHLGDVTDGTTPGNGENVVDIADISLLGAHYGDVLTYGGAFNYLDVGPTSDFTADALPLTDNQVQFEDMMVFALNYEEVSKAAPVVAMGEEVMEDPVLRLELEGATGQAGRLTARLVLDDHRASVKGIHAALDYDRSRLRLVSAAQGELLDQQSGFVFFKQLDTAEGAEVDAAIFGRDVVLAGSGEVAVLTFEVTEATAAPRLGQAVLRDRDNRPVRSRPEQSAPSSRGAVTTTRVPTTLELLGARPNPFDASTDIAFRLPAPGRVSVRIYDVSGRLVRTLVDGTRPAGERTVTWDGRTDDGGVAGTGIYFYRFRAVEIDQTRKLVRTR